MSRIRRSRHLFALIEDEPVVDLEAFFQGRIETDPAGSIKLFSLLSSRSTRIDVSVLEMVRQLSTDQWLEAGMLSEHESFDSDLVADLIDRGVLISDGPSEREAALRERDEKLSKVQWDPSAAFYYVSSRWGDRSAPKAQVPESEADVVAGRIQFTKQLEQAGPPPPHFHQVDPTEGEVALPLANGNSPLRELLRTRKTTRYLDDARSLALDDVSALLFYAFGCQGYQRVMPELVMLKKTSPAGGAMHAIEAYPLILNVAGITPGLYHYNVERHALSGMRTFERGAAKDFADAATTGQSYARTAHALLFLTARFNRHNWKYGRHKKAYKSVLMSAAHMSQSLYLLCAEMKLGVFFTAALNDKLLEQTLGLDFLEEGVVAAIGCGVPKESGFDFSLQPEPYTPRETDI